MSIMHIHTSVCSFRTIFQLIPNFMCENCLFVGQLEVLQICYSEDADEKVREECCPGSPFITFLSPVCSNVVQFTLMENLSVLFCGDVIM